jgi:hypothetical protein
MIRYSITRLQLENLIEVQQPGWIARAGSRTKKFITNKLYEEKSSIWSEVKPVYIKLQGESKCAYCERKLESIEFGLIEQDVDHFRPKGTLAAWSGTSAFKKTGISASPIPIPSGYYGLAYDVFNYAASCKPCNSPLKHNHFPILGAYNFSGLTPEKLKSEKPLLIYPIGKSDKDPESLIGFYGVSPKALLPSGHGRERALATIDFFRLDDVNARSNLFLERGRVITALYSALLLESLGAPGSAARQREITAASSDKAPHSNCARSFIKLFQINRAEADKIYDEATKYLESKS